MELQLFNRTFEDFMRHQFRLAPLGDEQVARTVELNYDDFEDAMLVACA